MKQWHEDDATPCHEALMGIEVTALSSHVLIGVPTQIADDRSAQDEQDVHHHRSSERDLQNNVEQREQGDKPCNAKGCEDQIL